MIIKILCHILLKGIFKLFLYLKIEISFKLFFFCPKERNTESLTRLQNIHKKTLVLRKQGFVTPRKVSQVQDGLNIRCPCRQDMR